MRWPPSVRRPADHGHRRTTPHSAMAILAGMTLFAAIYTYSGDADLLYAVGSGMGASLILYLLASVAGVRRNFKG